MKKYNSTIDVNMIFKIKRTNKRHTDEFKQEAVSLVLEQNYSVGEAAIYPSLTDKLLYTRVSKIKEQQSSMTLDTDERTELMTLRKENKRLQMERDILKKASAFFAKEMK